MNEGALESSRRDLQNALLCTVLESNPKKRGKPWGGKRSWSNPGKIGHRSLISKFSLKIAEIFAVFFPKIRKCCQNFAEFSPNLTKFFRDFSKMQHFSEIPNSEPLEFPEFSATSSSSAGRRKCPACADLASSSARPAAALRDKTHRSDRLRSVANEEPAPKEVILAGSDEVPEPRLDVKGEALAVRSEVNNSLIIVNFFHKIQNFRQIFYLFSQI